MRIRDAAARLLAMTGVVLAVVASDAAPAMADPAGPTDFRSEVTGIEPATDGVTAKIRGGDAFLELQVDEGVEVTVFDYASATGKPYLRFLPDGTVERNRNATATYINDDRDGAGEIPAAAQDPASPADWEEVASGGTYAWHDHRVHWMQEVTPGLRRGEQVGGSYDPWRVPIEVDGRAADVQGTLTFEERVSPLPWAFLTVVVTGLLSWGGRRSPVRAAGIALVGLSALAAVVGRADFASTPDGAGNPILWVLPVVALVLSAIALVRSKTGAAVVFALASVASLSAWALFRFSVFTKPVLPTELPAALDRATVAAALGVCVAAAYLAVTSGALKLPDLADDDVTTSPPS